MNFIKMIKELEKGKKMACSVHQEGCFYLFKEGKILFFGKDKQVDDFEFQSNEINAKDWEEVK